ncbi:GntR family transcriptional regulator [Actinoalloteichus sp. AHMU CJ021]|uniref:MocR-like pyridoxine biosynthesis transcription factor PdxR n=1 Tax=Actinoalloteichus sp. AHMU CJ021 TaxID=2072503 RepID=UPI000CA011F8|nr:GntR family transcriptional regulator [Actinoalloteichus sp. AHMU CJ021]
MTGGSDFLQLDGSRVRRGERTTWLAARLRAAIADGTLPLGARLPATRVLAVELGFSRGTVSEAYRRLADEGLIQARAGAGSTVAARPGGPPPAAAGRAGSSRAITTPTGSPVETGGGPGKPSVIDLAAGLPDLASFPRAAWLRAERSVLATASARQLGYGPPQGVPELREQLAAWLGRSRGVVAAPDRIVVTSGVSGALSLLAQVLRDRGVDAVALEDPGAEGNRTVLGQWLPRLPPVAVDEHGLDTAALARSGAGAVLVTPAHQYPTGVVLSPARRRSLLAWAASRDGLVIEDDYDAEYRYDRAPVRAVQPLSPQTVAYTASVSKTLAPGLRLGWLVPPDHLREPLVRLRWASDLGSPVLPQLTLARLLAEGVLERHLRAMRARHRARRDAVVAALRRWLPDCPVLGVAAGLHVLVLLPTGQDDAEIAGRARAHGVLVRPLSRHRVAPGRPGLVVNYAGHHPERLDAAVGVLARVIDRSRRRPAGPRIAARRPPPP